MERLFGARPRPAILIRPSRACRGEAMPRPRSITQATAVFQSTGGGLAMASPYMD